MAGPDQEKKLSIEQMLEQEYEFLHPELARGSPSGLAQGQDGPSGSGTAALEQKLLERRASALCLSGGGIRSATFCLGALQAFAASGKLKTFTYLSTVSGGGYVGSWLSRWIRQSGGKLAAVEKRLACGSANNGREEAPQVAELRAYSNYLSPVWGLSADFFTLVSIVLRNLLLNWCVLLPLIGAFVLFPYLYLALVGLKEMQNSLWLIPMLAVGFGCGVTGLTYVASDLPANADSGRMQASAAASRPEQSMSCSCLLGKDPNQDQFLTRAMVPVLAFVFSCTIVLAWLEPPWLHPGVFVLSGVLLHLAAAMLARRCQGCRAANPSAPAKIAVVMLQAVLVGVISGLVANLLCVQLKQLLPPFVTVGQWYAVLALPSMLFMLWLGTTGFVAIVRGSSSESMREWWARSGGWWLAAALFWLAWFGLILLLPQWLLGLPFFQQQLSGNKATLAVGGGLWGLLTGLVGYWSKHGATVTSRARKIADLIGVRLLELAAIVFIVALLLALNLALVVVLNFPSQSGLSELLDHWQAKAIAPSVWLAALVLAALLLFAFVSSTLVGVNTFSLHGMYGNRLVRAYLGAARAGEKRHPHPFTGFDNDDNIGMGEIAEQQRQANAGQGAGPRLFHVLNLTLNLVAASGKRLEWQQRKAASFSVTPLHAGSAELAYVDSQGYGSGQQRGISLGRAMTISGAAASPNMGYHSSAAVTFVMTLFNVRLGWWQPNPARSDIATGSKGEPGWRSLGLLLAEALGQTSAGSSHVYLSDGGHFENLGLYEMVRRRCTEIYLVDASADPGFEYEDLENAIRKIRVDFGIPIEFSADSFATPSHLAVGTIHYGERDDQKGQLYYIKPVLTDDLPLDVSRYAEASRARDRKSPFPHQPTADQFFDEAQFESYRMLGLHLTQKALGSLLERRMDASDCATATPLEPGQSSSKQSSQSSWSGLGNAALLASVLTVGGVLGVSGTVALEGASVEIGRESREAMHLSRQPTEAALALAAWQIARIADRLEGMPAASDPASTQDLLEAMQAMEKRLSALAQALSVKGGAIPGPQASMAQSLARLEADMAALSSALAERHAGATLSARLAALELSLRRIEVAVHGATR